ncbi:MAG: MFS transporter, partial [Planctomycetia bacterium]|nr:MFS transporter [Planctomycetia bacterium]
MTDPNVEDPTPAAVAGPPLRATRYRWVICGLLFFATTVNYVDRGVLGVLEPELKKTIRWTDTQYGDINAAFSLAYAIGFPVMGRLIDLVGTRKGYAFALVVWSLAAAGHALARTPFGFGVARFLLGIGEAG